MIKETTSQILPIYFNSLIHYIIINQTILKQTILSILKRIKTFNQRSFSSK